MASLLTRYFPWFPRPRFRFLKWWTRKNYEINSIRSEIEDKETTGSDKLEG
ncbi:hypothetical protein SLEP1_g24592 [Rubroshorea leprosula]|uniref:Uncharacterized protein n=1 Tax=Rubroshorea leprosula TaxID=152421 RepID=A0AAV5JG48_9ROSI|nr:hypothetical protein SLEP1_g24592 [Rubroshorea leprosula]